MWNNMLRFDLMPNLVDSTRIVKLANEPYCRIAKIKSCKVLIKKWSVELNCLAEKDCTNETEYVGDFVVY